MKLGHVPLWRNRRRGTPRSVVACTKRAMDRTDAGTAWNMRKKCIIITVSVEEMRL